MSNFSTLFGQHKHDIPAALWDLLQELSTGNADRDFVAKTITAALTGNVTGGLTGTHTGAAAITGLVLTPATMTVSDAVPASSFVKFNSVTPAIAATIVPTAGQFLIISQQDAGTAGHTLTTAGTFDGTNNTATFNAAGESLVLFAISSTRWLILLNEGSVALTAVP